MHTWIQMNPQCEHKLWNDTEIEVLVKEKSHDFNWMPSIWNSLQPTERADFFRYLVLYTEGGYYADLDVTCVAPIAEYQVPQDVSMLVGYEYGHRWSEEQRLEVFFARPEQFAKYFLAAAPQSPLLQRCLEMLQERFHWKVQDPVEFGTGLLSDAVHEFLEKQNPQDALAKENEIRRRFPRTHFLSYPSGQVYGDDDWKLFILPAGSVNSASQVASDDPDQAGDLMVHRVG